MNPNTPPPSDDDLPDEQALAALYARLPRAEPDPALDAIVLAAAARATPPRRRPRWPVALGSAAVLVLAAGVAWQLRDTPPPVAHAPAVQEAPTGAPSVVATPAPVAVPPVQKPARVAERHAAIATHVEARKVVSVPPPSVQSIPLPMPAPIEAPAPMAPPAPPPTPVPPAPGEVRADVSAPSLKLDSEPDTRAQAAYAPSEPVATPAPAPMAPAPVLDPDTRVATIRRLLGEGRHDEALRELKALRHAYPHYDLPQDLRDLER